MVMVRVGVRVGVRARVRAQQAPFVRPSRRAGAPATVGTRGCNRRHQRLQPCVPEAATICTRGYYTC